MHSSLSLYDTIPISLALISTSQTIVYTNLQWQKNLIAFENSHVFTQKGQNWPCKNMPNSLSKALKNAITKLELEGINQKDIQLSLFISGDTYHFTFSLSSIEIEGQAFVLVSIQHSIDKVLNTINPTLMDKNECLILNSLHEGVIIQDANGVITANNLSAEAILNLSSSNIRGRVNNDWETITEYGAHYPADKHPSTLARLLGIPVFNSVMGIKTPERELRWININAQPIFNDNEITPYITVTSFTDITEERLHQSELNKLSTRLHLALKAGNTGVWEYDIETKKVLWDNTMFRIFDVDPTEFKGELNDVLQIIHPDDLERVIDQINTANNAEAGANITFTFRILARNKEIRHIYSASTFVKSNTGSGGSLVGINRDISTERRAEEHMLARHDHLVELISSLPIAVFSISNNNIAINKQGEALIGYENHEINTAEKFFNTLFDDRITPNPDFLNCVTGNTTLISQCKMQIIRRNGQVRWVEFKGCRLEKQQAWIMHDISDQVVAEENLKKLAFYDPLTKLSNRTTIEKKLIASISEAAQKNTQIGLLILDLDQFKNVNDTYGHHVGDKLLIAVAERLKEEVRPNENFGRMGGDEFMVIIENLNNQQELLDIAHKLLHTLTRPIPLPGQTSVHLKTSISIGASVYPEHGTDHINLFKNADAALYKAKFLGKNRVQLYLEEFTQVLQKKLALENMIDQGMQNKAFKLHFQPIVNSKTNKTIGAECLTRWHDRELGNIPPDKFIKAAESSGQIIKLGLWILENACNTFVEWERQGVHLDYIAVNISPIQFNDASFISSIQRILSTTGLSPKHLVLEITEGILMQHRAQTKKTLLQLKQLNIRLAIDDFGTGYSSLAYLKYFDVSILKIDKSFIQDVMIDPVDAQITEAIISIAKNLNLTVVAEGVENTDQLEFVRNHHCGTYQGYLKSPALNNNDFIAFIKEENMEEMDIS
ncbi:EAL and GGDEF domain-containing protein [Marinomonas algicola]|uniref:sensor domain-containing protein n=1 Tax=Marinomonas algicola TaxID=2773454 RepID=UPI001EFF3DB1|nr:EAL domain-containing protein [Marinomonas algicola]